MSLMGILDRVADVAAFDKVIEPARRAVQAALRPQAVKDLLHGTWLGHPLHPVLVHVPVGTLGLRRAARPVPPLRPAATVLIGTGVAAAVPAALSGRGRLVGAGRRRAAARGAARGGQHRGARALRRLAGRARQAGRGDARAGAVLRGARRGERVGGDRRAHVLRAVLGRLARGDGGAGADHRLDRPRARSTTCPRAGPRCARARASSVAVPLAAVRRGARVDVFIGACSHLSGPLHEGPVEDGARARRAWSARGTARRSTWTAARRGGGRPPTAQEKLEVRMEAGRVMARLPGRNR